jgi:hypothetical protein
MAATAADRRSALALVRAAQLVYALSLDNKQTVIRKPRDVASLREHVGTMKSAARELSSAFRKRHTDVPWDALDDAGDEPNDLWTVAKRLSPKFLRALTPEAAASPDSAFFLSPAAPAAKARAKTPAKKPRSKTPARKRAPRGSG